MLPLRHRNRLRQGSPPGAAEVAAALLPRLPLAHDAHQFVLLGLEPRFLTARVLVRGHHHRRLAEQSGLEVVLPEVAVFRRIRGETPGGEQHRVAGRTDAERADPAGARIDRPDAVRPGPDEEGPLPAPGDGAAVQRTHRVRAGNQADLGLRQFPQVAAGAVHREPRVVVGKAGPGPGLPASGSRASPRPAPSAARAAPVRGPGRRLPDDPA